MEQNLKMAMSLVFGGLLLLLLHVYNELWLRPKRLRSKLEKQGIRGPSPYFFLGNIPQIKSIKRSTVTPQHKEEEAAALSHDWVPTIFPHLLHWQKEYGHRFLYSVGGIQQVCITDIDMVKEINVCTSFNLGKPTFLAKDRGPLLGQGIFTSNGSIWAYQRKMIGREFYPDKVKSMVDLMVESTKKMLDSWDSRIEDGGGIADINIDKDVRNLSADIIARACFGSDYLQGEEIFSKIRSLQKAMSKVPYGVPGLRHFPSRTNREIWKLEKEIRSAILSVVKQRMESKQEKDLLQMILHGADNYGSSPSLSQDKFIVDNCKSIYFAGHETTAITASWCLMFLAAHPDWQARSRDEVQEICQGSCPNASMIHRMKTLTMVIQETLRLYPPATFVVREALQDVEFNGIVIPKGMGIQIPTLIIQHHPDFWGADAHQFNPERFAHGIKNAQAYMPFGVGARTCLGEHFAMTQLKVVLSLLLSKFCFTLSPSYHHAPAFTLVVEPGHGVSLCLKRI